MLMEDDQAASGTAGVDAALASCGKRQDVLRSGTRTERSIAFAIML